MRAKYQLPVTRADIILAQEVIRTMKEKYGSELELDDEYTSWIVESGLLHRYLGTNVKDLEWVGEWFPTVPLRGWVHLFVQFIWRTEGRDVTLIPRVVNKITKIMQEQGYPRKSKYIKPLLERVLRSMQTKQVLDVRSEKRVLYPQKDINTPKIRLSVAHLLQRDLSRIHITSTNLSRRLIVLQSIGSASVYGDAYAVCVRDVDDTCKGYVAKEFHLALKLQTVTTRHAAQKLWNELHFLKWGQRMVQRRICINFPLVYKTIVMPNVVTKRHNIITKKGSLTIGILNELASGDFGHWLKTTTFGYNALGKFLFQGFMALYVVQNLWKSYHNDLHVGNFLYNRLKTPRRFVYDVVGKGRFIIRNCPFLVKLWDFGDMNVHKPTEALDDIEKIFTSLNEVMMKKGIKMYTRRMRAWVRKMAFTTNVWDALIEVAKISKDITFIPWRRRLPNPNTSYYSKIDHFRDEGDIHKIRPILTRSYLTWTQRFRQLG